jgi:voltage-gated potassium channel
MIPLDIEHPTSVAGLGNTHKQRKRMGELRRILMRIRYAAWALVGVLVLGTVIFYQIGVDDGSTWSDALFMSLITVTTVGYGEIVPIVTVWERLATGFLAVAGFGSLTFLFTSLSVFFLEQDLDNTLGRSRMEKEIGRLKGHFIVCGYGRVGQNIGRELQLTHRPYVAVDSEEVTLEVQAEHHQDLLFLAGDASDDDLLRAANIAEAEGVFAVTGDDSRNLMICITAKQLNPNVRIVARCHEVRNIEKLKKVGANSVVSPDFTGGMRMASAMVRPKVVSFLDKMLRSELHLRVEELKVPEGFQSCTLSEVLEVSEHYILVAMQDEKGWHFNPSRNALVEVGMELIVMASPGGRQQLESRLRERVF